MFVAVVVALAVGVIATRVGLRRCMSSCDWWCVRDVNDHRQSLVVWIDVCDAVVVAAVVVLVHCCAW